MPRLQTSGLPLSGRESPARLPTPVLNPTPRVLTLHPAETQFCQGAWRCQGPRKQRTLGGPLLGPWFSRWGAVQNLWLCHLAWQKGLCSGGYVRDPEAARSSGVIWGGPVSSQGSLSEESRGIGARGGGVVTEAEVRARWPRARARWQPPGARDGASTWNFQKEHGPADTSASAPRAQRRASGLQTAGEQTVLFEATAPVVICHRSGGTLTHVALHTERDHVPSSPLARSSGCKGNRPVKVIASVSRRMTPDDVTSPTLGFGVTMFLTEFASTLLVETECPALSYRHRLEARNQPLPLQRPFQPALR